MENPDQSRMKTEEERRQKTEALRKRETDVEEKRQEEKDRRQQLKEESALKAQLAIKRQKFQREVELARAEFARAQRQITPQTTREGNLTWDTKPNELREELARAKTDRESLRKLAERFEIDFSGIERQAYGRN
jgi:hypothetical protein